MSATLCCKARATCLRRPACRPELFRDGVYSFLLRCLPEVGLLAAQMEPVLTYGLYLNMLCKNCTVDTNSFLSKAAFLQVLRLMMTSVHCGLIGAASRNLGISGSEKFEPACFALDEIISNARNWEDEMEKFFEVKQVRVRAHATCTVVCACARTHICATNCVQTWR